MGPVPAGKGEEEFSLLGTEMLIKSTFRTIIDTIFRSYSGTRLTIGCIVFIIAIVGVRSEELTVRSGSRTVTIRPGQSNVSSHITTTDDFIRGMLAAHNDLRRELGILPLQWSEELAAYSRKWANSLMASNKTAHNPNSPYGENIFATGPGATPSSVVAEWASESRNYNYTSNSCNGDCGHYKQLVWRSTRKVGCAMAHNNQREVWICSYDPPGNLRGGWPY